MQHTVLQFSQTDIPTIPNFRSV